MNKAPHNMLLIFIVWLSNGDHSIKSRGDVITLKKDKNIAKITVSKIETGDFYMNKYCAARFRIFCELWLRLGKVFIERLEAKTARLSLEAEIEGWK